MSVPLTDKEILALKPQAKKFKVFDEDGLYSLVHPKGGKYWYMKYHLAGRPQEVAFGNLPCPESETGSRATRCGPSAAPAPSQANRA
jgi:Arm DNA-binding domain